MSLSLLKIAMLASNVIRVPPDPPQKYVPPGWSGAPEIVVHNITEELVRRGHDVTLFASGDSKTKAKLVSVAKKAIFDTPYFQEHIDFDYMLAGKAYDMAKRGNFDIIHSHFDIRSAHFARLVNTPTISTLHSPINGKIYNILQQTKKTQYYVSISNAQRKPLPDLGYIDTIYHGINPKLIPFRKKKEDYLIFSGRMRQEKGVAEAIELAKKTGQKLLLFGSFDPEYEYWQKKIKPHIDQKQIIYKGFVSKKELYPYLAKARAFIFPLQWDEPFGLTIIESLATGTPVIALSRGSLPELVDHGKTGFLCENMEQMCQAVKNINTIKPADCREKVERFFTIEKMVDGYEKAYHNVIKQHLKK